MGNYNNDTIKYNIMSNSINIGDAIKNIVDKHIMSDMVREYCTSNKYYRNNGEIEGKSRTYVDKKHNIITMKNKPNARINHNYHKIIVDMDINYCLGKAPNLSSDIDGNVDKLFDTIDKEELFMMLKRWMKQSEHGGIGWLYPYINRIGELKFKVMKSGEIKPFYDELTGELVQAYRIYKIANTEGKLITKVQIFDVEGITTYIEDSKGGFNLDVTVENPTPYITVMNSATNETKINNWGMIPLIPLRLNDEEIPSIIGYKDLIDDYDHIVSNNSDGLIEQFQQLVAISGFNENGKLSVDDITRNFKETGIVFTGKDGSINIMNSNVDLNSSEIHLKRINRDIFIAGMSADVTKEEFGGLSGIALMYMYQLLDLKINGFEPSFRNSFNQVIKIVNVYRENNNLEPIENIAIKFNRSMLVNITDTITAIESSSGLSQRTKLELNPLVEDADLEIQRNKDEETVYDINLNEGE